MTKTGQLIKENIRISLNSISSNPLRTALTIFIIAIGIMALVGILTAIEAIKTSITTEFTRMGANTFTIQNRTMTVHIGRKKYRSKNFSHITYPQARQFKRQYKFPATVSISVVATSMATVKYKNQKTNPNIPVLGADEDYLATGGYKIKKGRNFTPNEVIYGRNVAVIGSKIAKNLFGNENPLDKIISIGAGKYKVIGILEERGSSMGFREDEMCLLPVTNVRQYFSRPNMSFKISVLPDANYPIGPAMGEAEATFRTIRRLTPKDETDFNIVRSDNLAQLLIENLSYVTIAATIIGLITLLGAAVGLMNIMLVSVSERTREIGIRKAIGATSKIIKQQFLFETIVIGQLGGLLGIVLGILMGNIVASLIGTRFVVPWIWILVAIILTFGVSIVSGTYPAVKASKLDPIEALRYE